MALKNIDNTYIKLTEINNSMITYDFYPDEQSRLDEKELLSKVEDLIINIKQEIQDTDDFFDQLKADNPDATPQDIQNWLDQHPLSVAQLERRNNLYNELIALTLYQKHTYPDRCKIPLLCLKFAELNTVDESEAFEIIKKAYPKIAMVSFFDPNITTEDIAEGYAQLKEYVFTEA